MTKKINQNKSISRSRNNNDHILLIFCLICIMFMYELGRQQNLTAQLTAWKLLPQPDRFTELYIEDHLNLPRQIIEGERYPFRFTIHNVEFREMQYPYEIYAIENGKKFLITNGSVNLKHDEYRSIEAALIARREYNRTRIEIILSNTGQTIHFWMDGTLPIPTSTPQPENRPGFITL